jgi:regulator of protease activity HflC (stomatin/prohibitin superfamily)
MLIWFGVGLLAWLVLRFGVRGFYTVGPNERAVITTFGRAQRVGTATTLEDPVSQSLRPEEASRYVYPQVRVIGPGVHRKLPWQRVHKVSIATVIVSTAYDPDEPTANHNGTVLDAVTKDQLNTGFTGQLRYTISERNLYAYLFGVKNPVSHVMGYFVSILRDRVANFSAPQTDAPEGDAVDLDTVQGISINDLRKNLSDLNEHMNVECASAAARYGIALDAVLITGIDPPPEIESALAAINTAHNQVSSSISLAHAAADQRIVQSRRAVEIETLNGQAEVEPLLAMAKQLTELRSHGHGALELYVRNVRLGLFAKAGSVFTGTQDGQAGR